MSSITLGQLLQSRDERFARQVALTERFPGRTLVCMTVVLPGPVKRDARSLTVAEAGVSAVRQALSPVHEELRDLETGYEGYFLVDGPLLEVKQTCCRIEDTHPLGRLLDLRLLGSGRSSRGRRSSRGGWRGRGFRSLVSAFAGPDPGQGVLVFVNDGGSEIVFADFSYERGLAVFVLGDETAERDLAFEGVGLGLGFGGHDLEGAGVCAGNDGDDAGNFFLAVFGEFAFEGLDIVSYGKANAEDDQ